MEKRYFSRTVLRKISRTSRPRNFRKIRGPFLGKISGLVSTKIEHWSAMSWLKRIELVLLSFSVQLRRNRAKHNFRFLSKILSLFLVLFYLKIQMLYRKNKSGLEPEPDIGRSDPGSRKVLGPFQVRPIFRNNGGKNLSKTYFFQVFSAFCRPKLRSFFRVFSAFGQSIISFFPIILPSNACHENAINTWIAHYYGAKPMLVNSELFTPIHQGCSALSDVSISLLDYSDSPCRHQQP